MRASTGSQIEIVDLDQSQIAFPCRFFAQRQTRSFFRSGVLNGDRAALPNNLIREIDRPLNPFIGWIVEIDVNLAFVLEDAKAAGRRLEQLYERGRENMLSSMLLQMIETPQPIDFSVNLVTNLGHRPLNQVQDSVVLGIDAVNHASVAQGSGIVWLSSASRIKSGAVECD